MQMLNTNQCVASLVEHIWLSVCQCNSSEDVFWVCRWFEPCCCEPTKWSLCCRPNAVLCIGALADQPVSSVLYWTSNMQLLDKESTLKMHSNTSVFHCFYSTCKYIYHVFGYIWIWFVCIWLQTGVSASTASFPRAAVLTIHHWCFI